MIAYKLVRKMKNGSLASLFIDKKKRFEYNKWLKAECHPTKGFAVRPGWHCTHNPEAPHLSDKDRVWIEVEIKDFTEFKRPESQGGLWYLANHMKVRRILSDTVVENICTGVEPIKRKEILLSKLPRFFEGISKIPMPVEHLGLKKNYVGIGWVTEGEADGTEPTLIIHDED